jgi:hypothetical protein
MSGYFIGWGNRQPEAVEAALSRIGKTAEDIASTMEASGDYAESDKPLPAMKR